MKHIEIDDDLYAFIAAQTKHIGESASDILRRLLLPETPREAVVDTSAPAQPEPAAEEAPQTEVTAVVANELPAVSPDDLLTMVSEEKLAALTKRVDQFLYILAVLHAIHGDQFKQVEDIRGKNRTYFAQSKAALLENGSSTNPKPIPESEFWVVTNNNTAKKVAMLSQVMQRLGYDESVINQVVAIFSPESN